MISHETNIFINRPIEQVFEYTMNEQNLHNWQADFVSGELLTDGPMRIGTRVRETRRMGPRVTEIQAEITDYEQNKRFATKTLTKPHATVSYTFLSENGGTRIIYKFTLVTTGIMRLIEPLMAGSIKKGSESDFEKLKQILESNIS